MSGRISGHLKLCLLSFMLYTSCFELHCSPWTILLESEISINCSKDSMRNISYIQFRSEHSVLLKYMLNLDIKNGAVEQNIDEAICRDSINYIARLKSVLFYCKRKAVPFTFPTYFRI